MAFGGGTHSSGSLPSSAENWYEQYRSVKDAEGEDPPFDYVCTMCKTEITLDVVDAPRNYQIWHYCDGHEACERNRLFLREDKLDD